jgi:4-hydroxy-3-polyprenylbenzoate decarboxylase
MSYYKSLNEYVDVLERAGLLYRIQRPINKDTEMHPLVRWQFRGLQEAQRRAFLFEQVCDSKGKQYDMPVLVGGLAGSQKIYALGLQCDETNVEEIWAKALDKPLEPSIVQNGEAQEVVYSGEALDRAGGLYKLPIPISTPGFDNAPYLTAGCWITKDPESGVRNMGVYRGQIKGPRKTGIMWGSLKHSAMHWETCNRKGVPLEAAVVIGGPPCITYAAVQPVPYGIDEIALAGGLARTPLELVKCKTIDLEVPANADIVIEGHIPWDYLEPDGPFGEAHGYLDPGDLNGVFEVSCITHKKDPIYVSMISQLTPSESSKIKQSAYETLALKHLQETVSRSVRRVAMYEDLLNRQVAVIQIDQASADEKWRALEGLLPSRIIHKIIVCVDPDIDPHDPQSLLWAIANRCQPHRDMKIVPNRPLPWNPIRYVADGERYDVTDSTLLVDATLKAEFPPVALPLERYMERARELWQELELPPIEPRPPWHGYSLGLWTEELATQASNATAGDHGLNAAYSERKGLRVAKGAKFMPLKEKFLAEELEDFRKQLGEGKNNRIPILPEILFSTNPAAWCGHKISGVFKGVEHSVGRDWGPNPTH